MAETAQKALPLRVAQRLRRMGGRHPIAWGSGVVLAAAALAGVLAWPMVRAHLEAIAVLDQVSGNPVPKAVGDLVAHPITVEDITVPTPSGPVRARVYLPTDVRHAPGMVVLHGVHHLGIDEPRMEGFAAAMASCGLRVLTPELPGIKDYHIGPESVRTIGESAVWFADKTGGPVSVLGLSFAGGLALVAAEDPAYAASMKMVVAVGSQDSMPRVAEYYRTGRDARPDGTVEVLTPHEYGPLVLEYEHLEDFVPADEMEPVRAVLRAHLYEDPAAEKVAMAAANAGEQALAKQLMDVNDARTQAALEASIEKHSEEMRALSPGDGLARLKVPVFLLHGEADNVIPAAETLWMAKQLPKATLQAALVSPVLGHVDVEKEPTARDEWNVVHLLAGVMRAAERR